MKKHQIFGVTSLSLFSTLFIYIPIQVFKISATQGWIYIIGIFISMDLIIYFYCAKCICREAYCAHIFPGYLTRLFPKRETGPYQFLDYLMTLIGLFFIFGFPNFLLWGNTYQLIIFNSSLVIIGFANNRLVCSGCKNKHCPACP